MIILDQPILSCLPLGLSLEERTKNLTELKVRLPSVSFNQHTAKNRTEWYWKNQRYGEFRGINADWGPYENLEEAEDSAFIHTGICPVGKLVESMEPFHQLPSRNEVLSRDPITYGSVTRKFRFAINVLKNGNFVVLHVTSSECSSHKDPSLNEEAQIVAVYVYALTNSIEQARKFIKQYISDFRGCVEEDRLDSIAHLRE